MNPYKVFDAGDGARRIMENDMVSAYLVCGAERALLVDTGLGTGDLAGIVRSLTALPLTVVCTHADPDHAGGIAQFDEVGMHPAEFAYHLHGGPRGAEHAEAAAETADRLRPVWEGDVFDLGGGTALEAVLSPGHTPGSLALLDRARRAIYTGDTISTSPIFMFGAGRDFRAYIASLEKLEGLRGAFDVCWPAHGEAPQDAGRIAALKAFAGKVLRGEAEGGPLPKGMALEYPAKLYVGKDAAFLAD
ncbi:MAG: MBL fold metallo-hydrolase [Clostridiales Family XIII bacterium]|nr:MBL fold metallo-hydrolase [Clostridiales Family XIII bacterium]